MRELDLSAYCCCTSFGQLPKCQCGSWNKGLEPLSIDDLLRSGFRSWEVMIHSPESVKFAGSRSRTLERRSSILHQLIHGSILYFAESIQIISI